MLFNACPGQTMNMWSAMQAIAVCVCGACVGMPSALSILSTECGGYIEY
jgi:hypothetical protein